MIDDRPAITSFHPTSFNTQELHILNNIIVFFYVLCLFIKILSTEKLIEEKKYIYNVEIINKVIFENYCY